MVDYATLVFDIESGPARTAATDLAKLNQAAVKASSGTDKLNKTLRDNRGRFVSSVDVATKYGSEIQSLAQKYNPALASAYRYQQVQVELNRAIALGVLTQKQADAALSSYTTQANVAASAANKFAVAQRGAGMQTANVFAQLNDIGVMMAAGQNPIQLALQQGTQLNQVWASMGKEGKSLTGVGRMLGSAFASMISPMNLLTIGVIAGGAALVQWAFSAGDADSKSNKLADSTDNLASSASAYLKAIQQLKKPLSDLTDEYGSQFIEVAKLDETMAGLSKAQLMKDITVSAEKAKVEFKDLVWYVEQYDWYIARGVDGTDVAARQARLLKSQYSLTVDQARGLKSALDAIAAANTPEEMASAMTVFAEAVRQASVDNAKISQDLLDAAKSGGEAAKSMQAVTAAIGSAIGQTNQWANAMWGVRSAVAGVLSGLNAISGQAIGFAAAEAEINALKAGKKVAEARHIGEVQRIKSEGALRTAELTRELGVRGKIQGVLEQAANLVLLSKQQELAVEQELAREREKESNKGGGGALTKAQNQFQSLRELLEQETLFEVAEYEKRQAQLDNALAKKLLSIEQYEIMKSQLQTFYFGTEAQKAALNYQMSLEQLNLFHSQGLIAEEAYQIRLAQLRGQYAQQLQGEDNNSWSIQLSQMASAFGEMNQLAGGGYDALLKAQRIFGAASALISTYTGAAEALKLPFPANIAAMGKVLAAGMGLVSAIKSGSSKSGKGAASSASATAAAAKTAPTQYVTIDVTGDSWAVGLVEGVIKQIQEQTKDGRVVFMGNGR